MALFSMTLNGTTITEHVITYERTKNICSAIGTLTVEIEAISGPNPDPWDIIILREDGHKKGTYYVSSIEKSANPGARRIQCQDGSKRIANYFIADIYNINYMSYARYWIEKFLTEAGVDYEFTTDSDGALLSENFTLGPSTAYDIITTLLQNSAWYMFFDENNHCTIGALDVDLTQPPSATVNATTIMSMKLDKNDSMLRNRAVVWGVFDPTDNTWVYADLTQHTPWDRNENDIRTVLLSNSCVRSEGTAYSLAAKMLEEFGKLTYEKSLEVAGEVDIDLGEIIKVNTRWHKGECLVTTIGSRCGPGGLVTVMVLDQRCPRLMGYVSYSDYVYVGTDGAGVWRKPLDSNLWENFSTGLLAFNVTDLIIKNGIFACVSNGVAYVNTERVVNWIYFDPVTLLDEDNFSFPTGSFEAVAVDIDDYTNNIIIGYRLLQATADVIGEFRSWIVEITPDLEVISRRQIFIIDADHQDFKLLDVDKYASADRLGEAIAPASYAPSDPDFWGTRKVYRFEDPEPKAIVLGPPPDCEVYTDPLIEVATHAGNYYEDSHCIVEGNAISGFWSNTWLTTFTYDYVIGDTPYNIEHLIEWPIIYSSPYGENYLLARIVYRRDAHGLSDATKEQDRMYHVCDIVNHNGEISIYHHTVTPLLDCYPYQIQNVDCATTGNIVLYDEQTIDGVSAVAGTRVLVKDQTNPIENGIYYVHDDATWSRSIDTNLDETLQNGMFVIVDSGTLNRWTAWQVESDGWNTIGVSNIVFVRVLELLAGSAQSIGGSSEFHVELPNVDYTAVFDRRPRMREGVIYYLYDGHINTNTDPGNPFLGPGTHYFYAFTYDIFNWASTKSTLYQYDYWGGYKPSIQTYSATELIPAGLGVGFATFIFTWYPKYESKCDLLMASLIPGGNNITTQELWKSEGYNDSGCGLTTDNTGFSYDAIAWTGTEIHGKNPSIDSYAKFRILFVDTTLVCPCIWPGNEFFTQKETMVTGNINLRDFSLNYVKGYRGWELKDCQRDPLDDTIDYDELAYDYTRIYPLYVRDSSAIYIYTPVTIYDSKNISVSTGALGYLDAAGLISPQQDDFDKGIYVFDPSTRTVYKESTTGTILSTLNIPDYNWPSIGILTGMLYSNGYFFFATAAYKSKLMQHFILKLKDEFFFPGKDFCYLLKENKSTGTTRGLDYTIKDYDFYPMSIENSQEYPLVSWTIGNPLLVYSGCGDVGFSGVSNYLKWYDTTLIPTTISGQFNDTRTFTIAGSFATDGGNFVTDYGKYIGVTISSGTTVEFISSVSIDSNFTVLHTFSGVVEKLEFSNSQSPYIFVSISGTDFFQRDPGAASFVEYPPIFSQSITTIRQDDRV
jgi:hypothetical protein